MNFYKITGQVTAACSRFMKSIGFKNIKTFEISYSDSVILKTVFGEAEIRFNSPGTKGVYWSVDDFQCRVNEKENPSLYDESKFENALKIMIEKHDANIGITWDTIDYYLDEHCKK